MAKRIQWSSIAEAPIACALVGSFLMHFIFVLLSGNLLSQKKPEPRPVPQKFKIAMVKREPQPEKKSAIKQLQDEKPREVAPEILRKPRSSYSAAKIEPKEIALEPVSHKIQEPVKMEPQNIKPVEKMVQQVKANVAVPVLLPSLHQIEPLKIEQSPAFKVAASRVSAIKPADASPLPGPVQSAAGFPAVLGKQARVYKSAAGFAPSFANPKPVAGGAVSAQAMKTTQQIRASSRSLATGLPNAQKIGTSNVLVAGQKNPANYKVARRPDFGSEDFLRINPLTPDLESGVPSNNMDKIYTARAAVAANLPAPRAAEEIVDGGVLRNYLQKLQGEIAAAKQYPEAARESGQEGKVTIRFTVMKNGEVKNIALVSKTDYPELDQETIAAVKRAAPFPGLPDEIGQPFLEIILPFKFQLQE